LRGTQLELLRLVRSSRGSGWPPPRGPYTWPAIGEHPGQPLVERGLLTGRPTGRPQGGQLRLTDQATTRLLEWRRARAQLINVALDRLRPADREAVAAALPAFRR